MTLNGNRAAARSGGIIIDSRIVAERDCSGKIQSGIAAESLHTQDPVARILPDDGIHVSAMVSFLQEKHGSCPPPSQIQRARCRRVVRLNVNEKIQASGQRGVVVMQDYRVVGTQQTGRPQFFQCAVQVAARHGGLGVVHRVVRTGCGREGADEQARKHVAEQRGRKM